jgi:hypothetical protein
MSGDNFFSTLFFKNKTLDGVLIKVVGNDGSEMLYIPNKELGVAFGISRLYQKLSSIKNNPIIHFDLNESELRYDFPKLFTSVRDSVHFRSP